MKLSGMVFLLAMALLLSACGSESAKDEGTAESMSDASGSPDFNLQSVPFATITGEPASLADFNGQVILIVNVASKCGHTPQYEGLEALYREFKDSGFVVLGFPANNFGGQEPGSNEEILQFCTSRYDVTFPMMAKISVAGADEHPLYQYLTKQSPFPGEIGWNFTKFLIDRDGVVVARFDTKVEPSSDRVRDAIRAAL